MEQFKIKTLEILVNNLQIIYVAVGALIYSYLEYRLGDSSHGSLIGFLRYYFKKKSTCEHVESEPPQAEQ